LVPDTRRYTCSIPLLLLAACSSPDKPADDNAFALPVPTVGIAAGPRLSTGADGTIVLSWMEADETGTTLWYSTLADDAWRTRQAVVSGKDMFVNWADLPSVVPLSDKHWVAHWLEMAGEFTYSYHVVISQSFDEGVTWSEPVKPHTDDTPTEHGFVSLFSQDGNVSAIWLDGRKTGNEASNDPTTSGMTLRAATIDADGKLHDEQLIDELICDCCQTDVAVADSGPVAVYRDRTVDEIRDIFVSRNVDGEWEAGVPLNNDNWQIAGCPVNGPAIAAEGNQVAAAWFSVPEQEPAVRIIFSNNGGASFEQTIPLATDGALGHVDTVLLPDGSAVVSWLQSGKSGIGDLLVRHVTSDRRMGATHKIASNVPARSVPQMVLSGNDIVFVWTESKDKSSRIKSTRLPTESLPSANR
jgi:hypothetical protein